MSRTKHHGDKAKLLLFEGRRGRYSDDEFWVHTGGCLHRLPGPKRKRSESRWFWMATPGWWVKEMMTKPQRAQTRAAIHEVMKMQYVVDDPARWGYVDMPNFPLAKKPHVYYW